MAAIRGHFETSTFLATIAFSAAGASITVPALLLAFRPSLDRKALRRGSLVPVATMAILVWSVAFVITHNRYGPEPSLADAWTLGAAVYSDVLMVWLLIAGAWAVRADKGHN